MKSYNSTTAPPDALLGSHTTQPQPPDALLGKNDAGPTLFKCHTNVLFLLGPQRQREV